MPIVVMKLGVKESSLNRNKQHDFPTPESPIRRSLIWWEWLAEGAKWMERWSKMPAVVSGERGGEEAGESGCAARTHEEVVVSCTSHGAVCGPSLADMSSRGL
jgi:hypothetical protein